MKEIGLDATEELEDAGMLSWQALLSEAKGADGVRRYAMTGDHNKISLASSMGQVGTKDIYADDELDFRR